MTRAFEIATQAQNFRSLRAGALAMFMSIVLTACGGGAETTNNPQSQNPGGGGTTYTGPAPRDSDVLKFQQEFWSKARTTDRCGNCHNETVGQVPMFVRNDDVNLAYDAATTVVDQAQPSMCALLRKSGSCLLGTTAG